MRAFICWPRCSHRSVLVGFMVDRGTGSGYLRVLHFPFPVVFLSDDLFLSSDIWAGTVVSLVGWVKCQRISHSAPNKWKEMANTYIQLPVLPCFHKQNTVPVKYCNYKTNWIPVTFDRNLLNRLVIRPSMHWITNVCYFSELHVSFNCFLFLISCGICHFIFACSDVADRKAFQQHSSRSVDRGSNWGILRAPRKSSQIEVSP